MRTVSVQAILPVGPPSSEDLPLSAIPGMDRPAGWTYPDLVPRKELSCSGSLPRVWEVRHNSCVYRQDQTVGHRTTGAFSGFNPTFMESSHLYLDPHTLLLAALKTRSREI